MKKESSSSTSMVSWLFDDEASDVHAAGALAAVNVGRGRGRAGSGMVIRVER
jgi:hypothetical protein